MSEHCQVMELDLEIAVYNHHLLDITVTDNHLNSRRIQSFQVVRQSINASCFVMNYIQFYFRTGFFILELC